MPTQVSTEHKLEMIRRCVEAGFKKIEVTSFAHPGLLPQFRDAQEVLAGLAREKEAEGVSYVVLMPNEKGFDRFEACVKEGYGAHEIILMISASETHNLKNFRLKHRDAKVIHARIMRRAHDLGVKVIGCVGTVYGCPVDGDIPMALVEDVTRFYVEQGAESIMLGDTTGVANPHLVRERVGRLRELFPQTDFIAHFHDTRGSGVANTLAALDLGLPYVDSSLGAIGGQPATGAARYHLGYSGNTCTEDLVALLEEMGVKTGIDVSKLIQAGHRAEEILGMKLRSNVIHSGPVCHGPPPGQRDLGLGASGCC